VHGARGALGRIEERKRVVDVWLRVGLVGVVGRWDQPFWSGDRRVMSDPLPCTRQAECPPPHGGAWAPRN